MAFGVREQKCHQQRGGRARSQPKTDSLTYYLQPLSKYDVTISAIYEYKTNFWKLDFTVTVLTQLSYIL